jgi:hypothetical protein
MSEKKLAPRARKLANPGVDVDEPNPPVANRDYETDTRNAADRDGNQAQARKRRTPRARSSAGAPPARARK